jgi:hypothetical protein
LSTCCILLLWRKLLILSLECFAFENKSCSSIWFLKKMRSSQGKAQKKKGSKMMWSKTLVFKTPTNWELESTPTFYFLKFFFSFLLPPPKLGANTIPLWWTFNPLPHFERVISPRAIELYELLYILIKMKGTDEFSMDIFHLFLCTYSQVFFFFLFYPLDFDYLILIICFWEILILRKRRLH